MADYKPDFSTIDVKVRSDANHNPLLTNGRYKVVLDGSTPVTTVDLQAITIPLANDRSTALNQSVANEFRVVQASNDRIGALNNAMQELQGISPTGVNDDKQAKVDVPQFDFDPDVTL